MKHLVRCLVAPLVALLLSAAAHARATVPIVDYENLVVATTSGKQLTVAELREVIIRAGRSQGWDISDFGDGHLAASFNKSKHAIMVNIVLKPNTYSVTYKDSVNMKFEPAEKKIHPGYNKWVRMLVDTIRIESQKL